jgi:hypothetical protein
MLHCNIRRAQILAFYDAVHGFLGKQPVRDESDGFDRKEWNLGCGALSAFVPSHDSQEPSATACPADVAKLPLPAGTAGL